MTTTANGDKTKLIMFLLGILQTIITAWCWWIGTGVVEAKTDISALQANYVSIMRELTEIKSMVSK